MTLSIFDIQGLVLIGIPQSKDLDIHIAHTRFLLALVARYTFVSIACYVIFVMTLNRLMCEPSQWLSNGLTKRPNVCLHPNLFEGKSSVTCCCRAIWNHFRCRIVGLLCFRLHFGCSSLTLSGHAYAHL